jgi:tryptophanyl-tRNA synthetase
VLREWGGKGFGAFKPALAELAITKLAPIGAEMRRLTADPAALDKILRDGAEKADAIAAPILRDVRDLVGLWR